MGPLGERGFRWAFFFHGLTLTAVRLAMEVGNVTDAYTTEEEMKEDQSEGDANVTTADAAPSEKEAPKEEPEKPEKSKKEPSPKEKLSEETPLGKEDEEGPSAKIRKIIKPEESTEKPAADSPERAVEEQTVSVDFTQPTTFTMDIVDSNGDEEAARAVTPPPYEMEQVIFVKRIFSSRDGLLLTCKPEGELYTGYLQQKMAWLGLYVMT